MRWVKLTLPRPVRDRWLLRIWRLTSSSFAGTVRTDVAVGTRRLASMLVAVALATPRSVCGCSPSSVRIAVSPAAVGFGGAGAGAGVGGVGAAASAGGAVAALGW